MGSVSLPPFTILQCFNGSFHCLESCLMNRDYIIHTTITCTPHLDGSLNMYILPVILQFSCTMQGGNQIEFEVTCSNKHGNVSHMMFLVCMIIACFLLFALLSLFVHMIARYSKWCEDQHDSVKIGSPAISNEVYSKLLT